MGKRSPGSRRSPGSKKEPGNQSEGISTNFDGLREGEISIGWEKSGIGLEVTISPSTVELTLGIGIASVTLDLGELNNSSISYAFDLYEIKGTREGCNVRLDYYISGQLVKSENRTIPECEEEEEKENENDRDKDVEDDFRPRPWEHPIPFEKVGFFIAVRGGYVIESAGNRIVSNYNWIYYQDTKISHKISLKKIVHRNPNKKNFFSAAYIFEFKRSGFRHAYDFRGAGYEGNDHYVDKSSRGTLALVLGDQDDNFYNQIQRYTSSILYSSFYFGGVVNFPEVMTGGPILAYAVDIFYGSHADMVRRIEGRRPPGNHGYDLSGWGAYHHRDYGSDQYYPDKPKVYILDSGHELIFEKYFDPPPSEPPSMGGRQRNYDPMNEKCCKQIAQIHKALAVKELLDNGLEVPNRLVAPNGKGLKKLKNYLEISSWHMRIQDHLGIHPFKASLTDANAAKAGNQEVEAQFVSGTAAMRKIVELLLENKGDAAARLNLQIRSAIALAQILQVVTIVSKSVTSLISFVGMPFQEKISTIRMPFDISLGARQSNKGFDPKTAKDNASQEIQINEEETTEEILPKFLNASDHPYVHPKFNGKFLSLVELIKGVSRDG